MSEGRSETHWMCSSFKQIYFKSDKFLWDEEADRAFEELKKTLSTAPVLAAPTDMEPMLLYVAANERVVSAVVVAERAEEGKSIQYRDLSTTLAKSSQIQSKGTHNGRS